jgi:hypothetical protein
MTQLTKDRNYYRQLSNRELLQLIKESTNLTELEQVLAERLKKKEQE